MFLRQRGKQPQVLRTNDCANHRPDLAQWLAIKAIFHALFGEKVGKNDA